MGGRGACRARMPRGIACIGRAAPPARLKGGDWLEGEDLWEGEAPAEPGLPLWIACIGRAAPPARLNGGDWLEGEARWEGEAPAEPGLPLWIACIGRAALLRGLEGRCPWEGEAPAEPLDAPRSAGYKDTFRAAAGTVGSLRRL